MNPERRIYGRRILYSPEYLDMGAENGGVVANLSEGGLGFQAVSRVQPDCEIPLSFSLGPGYRIEVKARVVWVSAQGKLGGAVFGELSKDARGLIREWVLKQEAGHEAEKAAPAPEAEEETEKRLLERAPQLISTQTAAMVVQQPQVKLQSEASAEQSSPVQAPTLTPDAAASAPTEPTRDATPVAPSNSMAAQQPPAPTPGAAALTRGLEYNARPGRHFSAMPSLSARKDAPASARTPASSTATAALFPPRNAENIFARSGSSRMEPEPKFRKGSVTLLIVSIVIAAGAVLAFYVRTHRQQVGDAIVRIGNSIAGAPAAASTAAAPLMQPAAANSPGTSAMGSAAVTPTTDPSADAAQAPVAGAAPGQLTKPGTSSPRPFGASANGQPAQNPAKVASSTATAAVPPYSGQAEYQRAENYLNGTGVAQDPAEAAEWFWRSLEAGNTDAAVPLADLYLQGNGVSRSCTQAHILLDTAARKGNSEAIKKLAQLPENCQ